MKIEDLKDHYIVCGIGNTGRTICEELHKLNLPFVVLDVDQERVDQACERGYLAVCGDALKDEVLEKAGIARAKGIFSVLASDPDNIFVTLTARCLNAKISILAEQHDSGSRSQLIRSGVTQAVDSGHIGGLRMVSQMIRPAAVSFLDSMIRDRKSHYRFEEVAVSEKIAASASTLGALKKSYQIEPLILAIKDGQSGKFDINPAGDHALKAGDVMVVLGSLDQVKGLSNKLNSRTN